MNVTGEELNELIEQNNILENYFRNTIIPQLFVDRKLLLRKFTPPAMKQFKLREADLGRSINDIKDNFRFESITDNIQHVIDSKEILEKEIQTTDLRWYQMNIIPYIVRETNAMNGVIITFIEITNRIKDLKELERLISDQETMLDTLSHDFKTPLTSVILALEIYCQKHLELSSEGAPLVKTAQKGIHKMQSIIKELIDSRRQQHTYQSEDELLNFENIIEDVRLTLSDLILSTTTVITTDIQVSEIFFSRRKLRSILYNLINNAIKFRGSEKPVIRISAYPENEFTVISVKDNGMGIEPEMHESIFLKYYRIPDEKTIEGSGIGLYLVKEIIRNAGGTISVESEKNKGSTFKIRLHTHQK